MASLLSSIVAQATEDVKENATNATSKPPSTPEGMAVAYGSIVIMALLPIFFGAYRSVNYHKENVSLPAVSRRVNFFLSFIPNIILLLFYYRKPKK